MANHLAPRPPESSEIQPTPNRGRLLAAVGVAFAVDLIQAPMTAAWLSIAGGPMEWVVNEGLDVVTMGVLTSLIGFHWTFLPAFVVESIPGLDIVPTWTGSVLLAKRHELRGLFGRRQPSVPVPGRT